MLSLPIVSFVATLALLNPVKGAAPAIDETVRFRIIDLESGRKICMEAIGNFNGAVVSTGTCFKVSPYIEAWTVENGGSDTDIGPATNLRVFGDKCLDVKDGVNANGTKVQIWTCGENNPNQKFNVNWDGSISWDRTGKCVDVTGAPGDGTTQLQIQTCAAGSVNQNFTSLPQDPIRVLHQLNPILAHSVPLCLTASGSSNGARVVLKFCSTDEANQQKWLVPVNGFGSISLYNSTKCLDVQGGLGTFVQIWECRAGNPNQKWIAPYLGTGNPIIQWAHHHKCVSTINRHDDAETQLLDCGAGGNQAWSQVELEDAPV